MSIPWTPICDKQITHIQYNGQSAELIVQFHQGHCQAYRDIAEEQYQSLLVSTNPYDTLIQLTSTVLPEQHPS